MRVILIENSNFNQHDTVVLDDGQEVFLLRTFKQDGKTWWRVTDSRGYFRTISEEIIISKKEEK
jgi:hypothetical protein